jgi:galactose mutarotase-like enzyme
MSQSNDGAQNFEAAASRSDAVAKFEDTERGRPVELETDAPFLLFFGAKFNVGAVA